MVTGLCDPSPGRRRQRTIAALAVITRSSRPRPTSWPGPLIVASMIGAIGIRRAGSHGIDADRCDDSPRD